jgi:hypothetical protein
LEEIQIKLLESMGLFQIYLLGKELAGQ